MTQFLPQKDVFLSHIIFPEDIVQHSLSSWLVGWNLDQFKCFVIGYVNQSAIKLPQLEELLLRVHSNEMFKKNKHLRTLAAPMVLGEWIPDMPREYSSPSALQARAIWLTLYRHNGIAGLYSIHSLGNQYETSVYMLSYPLIKTSELRSIALSQYDTDRAKLGLASEQEHLVGLINSHADVNSALTAAMAVSGSIPTDGTSIAPPLNMHSVSTGLVNLTISLLTSIAAMWHMILVVCRRLSGTTRPFLSYLLDRLTWRELQLSSSHNSSIHITAMKKVSLENVSIAFYQLNQKVNQFFFALQSSTMLAISWDIDARHRSKYWITTWNTIHFLFIDLIMGILCSLLLLHFSAAIFNIWSIAFNGFFEFVELSLAYFRNSPAGVKLNPYITRKLGKLCMFFLRHWKEAWIQTIYPHQSAVLAILVAMGPFGFSMQVAVGLDFLRVMLLPMTLFHSLFALEFAFHCQLVHSLFLFFRSAKKNVLRQRYDSCDYDADQLPFGTMLFSIMLFLLPSFAVYYYFFAIVQTAMLLVIYLAFSSTETIKFLPYQSMLGRLRMGDHAVIDAVEIHCLRVTMRGSANDNSLFVPPERISSSTLKSSKDTRKGKMVRDDADKLQLLEGLIEGLSPKNQRPPAFCFDVAGNDGRHLNSGGEIVNEEGTNPSKGLSPLEVPSDDVGDGSDSDHLSPLSPLQGDDHDEPESPPLLTAAVLHRASRKANDSMEAKSTTKGDEEQRDNQSSSPSASAATPSVADVRDMDISSSIGHFFPPIDHSHRMNNLWLQSSSHVPGGPTKDAASMTTHMAYVPSSLRLTRRYAACISWMQHILFEKPVFWQLMYRVGTMRMLRCKISKVARLFHQQLASLAEQDVLATMTYLANIHHNMSGKSNHERTFSVEQRLDEYKLLVSQSLSFRKVIQTALTGKLPSQQASDAMSSLELCDDLRASYCRKAVLGVLSAMTLSLLCVVASLLFLVHFLYFPSSSAVLTAWRS